MYAIRSYYARTLGFGEPEVAASSLMLFRSDASLRDIEKVFNLFERLGNDSAAGEGMGLAYVRA